MLTDDWLDNGKKLEPNSFSDFACHGMPHRFAVVNSAAMITPDTEDQGEIAIDCLG